MLCTGTNFLSPDLGWRLSLGLASVPALVFFVGSVLLPDTPNSLVQRGHEKEGQQVHLRHITHAPHSVNSLDIKRTCCTSTNTKVRFCCICLVNDVLRSHAGHPGVMMVQMQVLELVRGTKEIEAELADIKDAVEEAKRSKNSLALFTERRHTPQLLFTVLIPLFQQFTGINCFIFYGTLHTSYLTILCTGNYTC